MTEQANKYPGYTLVRREASPLFHGTATTLTHDVSGATVLLIENEDENKAFGIGFGTFPCDDTGVFHILEHSVLAGSEKYPVTSPFMQLVKSSMASFLNAMTFPDKTVLRFGEDIDFSIRIFKAGCRCRLFPEAWVWHKRRTDFRKFFRQVFNSGIARINLYKKYPESLKLVHMLPMVFTVGVCALVLTSAVGRVLMEYDGIHKWYWLCAGPWLPILFYCFLIFADSSVSNKSLKVGLLSVPAAFIQLFGYGCGFLTAWWKRCLKGQDEFHAFDKTFYK